MVASAAATLELYDGARTSAVVNREVKPTVAFADNPDLNLGDEQHGADPANRHRRAS